MVVRVDTCFDSPVRSTGVVETGDPSMVPGGNELHRAGSSLNNNKNVEYYGFTKMLIVSLRQPTAVLAQRVYSTHCFVFLLQVG